MAKVIVVDVIMFFFFCCTPKYNHTNFMAFIRDPFMVFQRNFTIFSLCFVLFAFIDVIAVDTFMVKTENLNIK